MVARCRWAAGGPPGQNSGGPPICRQWATGSLLAGLLAESLNCFVAMNQTNKSNKLTSSF